MSIEGVAPAPVAQTTKQLLTSDGRKALFYPRKFKTSLCRTFMSNGVCEYGEQCSFAHGFDELRNTSSVPVEPQPTLSLDPNGSGPSPVKVSPLQVVPSAMGKTRSASFNNNDSESHKAPLLNRFGSFSGAKVIHDPMSTGALGKQRSPVNRSLYHTELCRTFSMIGFCPYGDSCQFAHGAQQLRAKIHSVAARVSSSSRSVKDEQTIHQQQHQVARHSTFTRDRRTYKTELCRQFQQIGHCDYDNQCLFAHGISQLRAANDVIVLPPEDDSPPTSYMVPTAIRAISTHQAPALVQDPKVIQVVPSPTLDGDEAQSPTHTDVSGTSKKSVCNPQLFKTAICRTYSQFGNCPYGYKCRFAHGLSDLRPAPRFKAMPGLVTGAASVSIALRGVSGKEESPVPSP